MPCVQLKGISNLQSNSIAKLYLNSSTLPIPGALASPVLGKRNYRDEVKPRLNRRGMAFRERSAPCVPVRVGVTRGRHSNRKKPRFSWFSPPSSMAPRIAGPARAHHRCAVGDLAAFPSYSGFPVLFCGIYFFIPGICSRFFILCGI